MRDTPERNSSTHVKKIIFEVIIALIITTVLSHYVIPTLVFPGGILSPELSITSPNEGETVQSSFVVYGTYSGIWGGFFSGCWGKIINQELGPHMWVVVNPHQRTNEEWWVYGSRINPVKK